MAAKTGSARRQDNRECSPVTCLFLDIGGVLLTDGWDRHARQRAAATFELDLPEMEERHHLTWNTYQAGKLSLDDYLGLVVFDQQRSFTRARFRRFIFAQSRPHRDMIDMVTRLRHKHGLKIIVVSNEGRELNSYRIHKFKLNTFVDSFVSSCFVHLLKPDIEIFHLAVDIAQTPVSQIIYIEDTPMFVQIARGLGVRSILHASHDATADELGSLGLAAPSETSRRA
jgi:putative hydrolase of the HAD superfamily